jgi:SAM-dependent methyltransferase
MKTIGITFFVLTLFSCSSEQIEEGAEEVVEVEESTNKKSKNNMSEFWDKRYASEDYVYGKEPNQFFKESLDKLPGGKVLLPADGEGRNAVYAATQGWDAYAFDISSEGKEKALLLANEMETSIDYQVVGFDAYEAEPNSFDVIALIYAHLPAEMRESAYQKCVSLLKPGGTLILEGFSKKQLGLKSGGPKSLPMLFSVDELKNELRGLDFLRAEELSIELHEGEFHVGKGEVVQIIATKK